MKHGWFVTLSGLLFLFCASTTKALPSNTELQEAGLYNVLDPQFGTTCKNDASTDCTQTIQKAIDQAYYQRDHDSPQRGVVFFPPGKYLISDTLNGLTDRKTPRDRGIVLMGSTATTRPQLILAANSFNDGNASNDAQMVNKKAMVHIWACTEANPEIDTECLGSYNDQKSDVNQADGNTGMQMSSGFRNLELVIRSGNPDAIGIRFAGTQDNIISNVKITNESDSYAGMYSTIGDNSVIENFEVVGGKYGLHGGQSTWPSYNNIRLINQTVAAITGLKSGGPWSINGFYIEKASAPAISDVSMNFNYYSASHSGGAYALSDGIINIQNASAVPVIDNPGDRSVTLQNVYIKNGTTLIKNGSSDSVEGTSNGWSKVEVYANTPATVGVHLQNGNAGSSDLSQIQSGVANNPNEAALRMKHGVDTSLLPSPDVIIEKSAANQAGYIYVKHKSLTPLASNITNDAIPADTNMTPQLQSMIDSCQQLPHCFIQLGRGRYVLKGTLDLKANTRLYGVANFLTEIVTNPAWQTDAATDVIRSPNDASATTAIGFFKPTYHADPRVATFNLFHWRSGKDSLIYGVLSTRSFKNGPLEQYKPRAEYLVTDNGGGRWFGNNTSGDGRATKWIPNYRGIKILNTTQPLTIYGLDPEDAGYNCLTDCRVDANSMQVEIRNAQNISIRGFKCEDSNAVNVFNTQNFFASGIGGCTDWYFENSDNWMVLNMNNKNNSVTGKLIEEKYNNSTADVTKKKSLSVARRGELPNFSVWEREYVPPIDSPHWDLDNDEDVDVFDFNHYIKQIMLGTDAWTSLANFIAAFRSYAQ